VTVFRQAPLRRQTGAALKAGQPVLPAAAIKLEEPMQSLKCVSRGFIAGIVGLAAGFSTLAAAQSPGGLGTIADNDSIFVDGTTFKITPGKAMDGASPPIKTLGARDLGPGAIIFRSGKKLYIVDAPLHFPGGQNVLLDAVKDHPNRIRIEYVPPKNPEHQMLYEMIRENHVLETMTKMFSPFRLPVDLMIKTMGCDGLMNAWYNTDNSVPTVHICYELLDHFLKEAPKETTPLGVTRHDAVVGQFFFFVTHELGHAMFDIYQISLFGNEEGAADHFAGYIMLQFGKDESRRLFNGLAYMAREFFKTAKQNPEVEKRLEIYSDIHGTREQRTYNIMCLAYGSDPELFVHLAEFIPKSRIGNCEYEYQATKRAFQNEIAPHVDRQMARSVLDTTWLPQSSAPPVPR
jgi:hypothetical protein